MEKLIVGILLLLSSCAMQKNFSGYLLTVTPNSASTQVHYLKNTTEVDSVVLKSTGLEIDSKKLINAHLYFDIKNGEHYIYVEKIK